MAIALRGLCPECGKVGYRTREDAQLAATLYTSLKGVKQDVYPGCGVWHLRDKAKHNKTRKLAVKRKRRLKYLTAVASVLQARIDALVAQRSELETFNL